MGAGTGGGSGQLAGTSVLGLQGSPLLLEMQLPNLLPAPQEAGWSWEGLHRTGASGTLFSQELLPGQGSWLMP